MDHIEDKCEAKPENVEENEWPYGKYLSATLNKNVVRGTKMRGNSISEASQDSNNVSSGNSGSTLVRRRLLVDNDLNFRIAEEKGGGIAESGEGGSNDTQSSGSNIPLTNLVSATPESGDNVIDIGVR